MKKTTTTRLTPVSLAQVQVEGGFWGERMQVNREVTIPIAYEQCRRTGRLDAWKLKWKPGDSNPPHIFWDSDVGKWLEAASLSLATHPDRRLEQKIDAVVELMARAQRPDGYLNTHYIAVEPDQRWTNLRDCHELYCAGHLIEGAVAYFTATGKRNYLEVMCRYADHIGRQFGPGRGQKRGYCGHEEIELALVKLYRATGEQRYLDLARFFIDERGRLPHYFDREARQRGEQPGRFHFRTYEYNQSHLPVRQQTEVVGHAVRAMYLYSGMADVAMATGDASLLGACRRLWKNLTQKRMHLTGGVGPVAANEGFTFDYDLPNEGAYLETCAAIGLVFWAHRMLQAEADGQYADAMERALYNGTISGLSLDGERFFYGNPLAAYPGLDGNARFAGKGYHYRRSEWFGCACCPPNVARMVAQVPGYLYSTSREGVFVHLYAGSTATLQVAGQIVRLVQQTDYPWDGKIALTVDPEQPTVWTLALRIPGWCRAARLKVGRRPVDLAPITRKGYAHIRREWRKGDRVELILEMPPERVEAHPLARQDNGRVALQRGPLVYCLEEVDNTSNLNSIALPRAAALKVKRDPRIFRGIPIIAARAVRRDPADWKDELYRPAGSRSVPCPITAVPYFMWANRREGEMLVWIREA